MLSGLTSVRKVVLCVSIVDMLAYTLKFLIDNIKDMTPSDSVTHECTNQLLLNWINFPSLPIITETEEEIYDTHCL